MIWICNLGSIGLFLVSREKPIKPVSANPVLVSTQISNNCTCCNAQFVMNSKIYNKRVWLYAWLLGLYVLFLDRKKVLFEIVLNKLNTRKESI